MNLTEEQIRAILQCSGFDLAELALDATIPHPFECECDACQRQNGQEPQQ